MKPKKIGPDSLVQRAKDILFNRIDDELLAIDAKAGYCYSLNESASRAWELISSPTRIETVCRRLIEEFDIDKDSCERDIIDLFERLNEAGLLRIKDEATS
jgi:hypothetical protein